MNLQRLGILLTVVIGVHLAKGADASFGQTPKDLLEIESSLVKARKSLHGTVTVKFENNETPVPRTFTMYFSENRFRMDRGRDRIISTPTSYIRDTEPVEPIRSQSSFVGDLEIPDARKFGLACTHLHGINHFPFESHFLREDRAAFEISDGVEGGLKVKKVKWKHKPDIPNASHEYWLAVDMGYQPVFIRIICPDGGELLMAEMRSKIGKYEPDVWFPAEVDVCVTKGTKILSKEHVTVESAKFVDRLSDSLFKLEGMGLAEGREIMHDGNRFIWTSGGMIEPKVLNSDAAPSDSVSFGHLVAPVIGIVGFATLIIAMVLRHRRSPA